MADEYHPHHQLIDAIGRGPIIALGVSPQMVTNWRKRGISFGYRAAVAQLAGLHGVQLPRDFLLPPPRRADTESAAA